MSAENNHSGPTGEASDAAAEASNHAPDSVRGGVGVVTSHGEREKRAYVAPVEIPKRHQRTATIDMSKVRIAPDMKVQAPDPRRLPTTKLDIPPGALRPLPPPAAAEIADPDSVSQPQVGAAAPAAQAAPAGAPAASPWSQNAGLDRSMLPSAAMAQPAPAQAQRVPSMPPTSTQSSSKIGPGVWIAVVILAAIVGGGAAIALRGSSSNNADPVSSSAPITIPLPGTTTTAAGTDSTAEPEVVETNTAASAEATDPSAASPKNTAPRTAPRRTSPATKTAAPAPAPAPTTTRPRLFN